jgi:hypothetical protein
MYRHFMKNDVLFYLCSLSKLLWMENAFISQALIKRIHMDVQSLTPLFLTFFSSSIINFKVQENDKK